MYSQNVYHTFWQQRVGKERRALATHLKEHYGLKGQKLINKLSECEQYKLPSLEIAQRKKLLQLEKQNILGHSESSPQLKSPELNDLYPTASHQRQDRHRTPLSKGRSVASEKCYSESSEARCSYTPFSEDIRFTDNGRVRTSRSQASTTSSAVASTALKLEVENLVNAQIEKFVKPLQEQLRGEVLKREEAEGKLRELREQANKPAEGAQ